MYVCRKLWKSAIVAETLIDGWTDRGASSPW